MMDRRYEVLFEPVSIGPVTAPNRFVPVPHCDRPGGPEPKAPSGIRGIQAEGGWAIVADGRVRNRPDRRPLWPFPTNAASGTTATFGDLCPGGRANSRPWRAGADRSRASRHPRLCISNWGSACPDGPSHRPTFKPDYSADGAGDDERISAALRNLSRAAIRLAKQPGSTSSMSSDP